MAVAVAMAVAVSSEGSEGGSATAPIAIAVAVCMDGVAVGVVSVPAVQRGLRAPGPPSHEVTSAGVLPLDRLDLDEGDQIDDEHAHEDGRPVQHLAERREQPDEQCDGARLEQHAEELPATAPSTGPGAVVWAHEPVALPGHQDPPAGRRIVRVGQDA